MKKLMFFLGLILLGFSACGNLSDPDNIWNEVRETPVANIESNVLAIASFLSGTFEGVGEGGFYGNVYVAVTVDENGRISYVEVIDHIETPEFAERAFSNLIPRVLETQSADLDIISGATRSSTAFINAVSDALNQAQ